MDLLKIGIVVILIGFVIVIAGALWNASASQKSEGGVKFSFVGFIGPFPFGFGNDRGLLMTALVIGIVVSIALMVLIRSMR